MKGKRLNVNDGQRFGRLTVVRESAKRGNKRYFLCKCDCGKKKEVRLCSITSGVIVSCGCYNREIAGRHQLTHGMHNTRIYKIWCSMRYRCSNKNNHAYKNYGGRGISVCEEWQEFLSFYEWAMANGYADDLTIERMDVNGNYEPDNCTWATLEDQKRNTTKTKNITFRGETKTLRQWAEKIGVSSSTMCLRLKNGWGLDIALTARSGELPRKAVCK